MPGPGLPAALQDRKWQLKAADEVEWQQWLAQQKQAANITADTVYVQVGSGAHATACWLARPADGTVASLVNLRPAVPAACRLPCLVRWPPGSMPQCPKLRSRSLAALCNPPPPAGPARRLGARQRQRHSPLAEVCGRPARA